MSISINRNLQVSQNNLQTSQNDLQVSQNNLQASQLNVLSSLLNSAATNKMLDAKREDSAPLTNQIGNGGAPKSLAALLAMVGTALTKSQQNLSNALKSATGALEKFTADQASAIQKAGSDPAQLQALQTKGDGVSFTLKQQIQELSFNLQEIQQILNKVNETVTNLSKSQSDAQGAVTRNLAV
jgi:hypothetical protein